ncbi:MAG: OmpA family protein [Polyangiaceae bacterium]|nr:OmpA family protein [Polyangiaceae bacterium]
MTRLVITALAASLLVGCGYTKEEYQLQGDKLTRALAKQRSSETRADEVTAELEVAKQRVADLEEKMRALGIDLQSKDGTRIGEAAATLAERERALAEYRARAAKIDEARSRLTLLRTKLEDLTQAGVVFRARKNRLMIVLPDSFFEKDRVKKEGKEALRGIASVIKEDPVLSIRDYQVSGHTDDKGGKGDTIATTAARARSVLALLVDPKEGGLDRKHFSVAGYGDTDPAGPNDTEENRRLNRRVEIVVMPTASEMLDLRSLGGEPTAPKTPKKEAPKEAPILPGP